MKFDDLREAWVIVLEDGSIYKPPGRRGDCSFAAFESEQKARAHLRRATIVYTRRSAGKVVKLCDVGVLAGVPPD